MILFLGAGASKPFEIPTTRDFAVKAIEALIIDSDYKDCIEFIGEIKDVFGADLDLEVFLTLLDDLSKENVMGIISPITTRFILTKEKPGQFIQDKATKELSKKMLTGIKDFMRLLMADKIAEKTDNIIKVYNNLHNAINSIVNSRISAGDRGSTIPGFNAIVTTNYDRCIEAYLHRRMINFEDNTDKVSGQYHFNLNRVDSPRNLHLLKLHGSIDLFQTPEGNIIQLQYPDQKYEDLKKSAKRYAIDLKSEVILYPTESGVDRRIIESPFADLYYRFRKYFETHPKIVIVGSSMRDRTICSILDYGLANRDIMSNQPKIFLIDPEANAIKASLSNKGFERLSYLIKPIETSIDSPHLKNALQSSGEDLS